MLLLPGLHALRDGGTTGVVPGNAMPFHSPCERSMQSPPGFSTALDRRALAVDKMVPFSHMPVMLHPQLGWARLLRPESFSAQLWDLTSGMNACVRAIAGLKSEARILRRKGLLFGICHQMRIICSTGQCGPPPKVRKHRAGRPFREEGARSWARAEVGS